MIIEPRRLNPHFFSRIPVNIIKWLMEFTYIHHLESRCGFQSQIQKTGSRKERKNIHAFYILSYITVLSHLLYCFPSIIWSIFTKTSRFPTLIDKLSIPRIPNFAITTSPNPSTVIVI